MTTNESTPEREDAKFNLYDQIIEALTIFKNYPHYGDFSAGHDRVFAGPDPELVSDEDIKRLDELGWQANYDDGYFRSFM